MTWLMNLSAGGHEHAGYKGPVSPTEEGTGWWQL